MYYSLDPHTGKITKSDQPVVGAKQFQLRTKINNITISTVFLAINHRYGSSSAPPILFETMIFGGEHDDYQRRYCTMAEATIGHKNAVFKAKGLKHILENL